jgi:hypothetical protein
MYTMEIKWKSSNGKGLALMTWNARAGDNKWCGGMANTMIVSDGKFKEGIIELPSDRLNTKGADHPVNLLATRCFLPANSFDFYSGCYGMIWKSGQSVKCLHFSAVTLSTISTFPINQERHFPGAKAIRNCATFRRKFFLHKKAAKAVCTFNTNPKSFR